MYDDEAVFGQLAKNAEELDEDEFYERQEEFDVYGDGHEGAEDDNDGWATDNTEKPSKSLSLLPPPLALQQTPTALYQKPPNIGCPNSVNSRKRKSLRKTKHLTQRSPRQ